MIYIISINSCVHSKWLQAYSKYQDILKWNPLLVSILHSGNESTDALEDRTYTFLKWIDHIFSLKITRRLLAQIIIRFRWIYEAYRHILHIVETKKYKISHHSNHLEINSNGDMIRGYHSRGQRRKLTQHLLYREGRHPQHSEVFPLHQHVVE